MLFSSFCGVHGMYASFFEPVVRSFLDVYDVMLMKMSSIFILKITAKTFYFFSNLLIRVTSFLVSCARVFCPVLSYTCPTFYYLFMWCLTEPPYF
jgi:hypothetical protein